MTILSNDIEKVVAGKHFLQHSISNESWVAVQILEIPAENDELDEKQAQIGLQSDAPYALLGISPKINLEDIFSTICLTHPMMANLNLNIAEKY